MLFYFNNLLFFLTFFLLLVDPIVLVLLYKLICMSVKYGYEGGHWLKRNFILVHKRSLLISQVRSLKISKDECLSRWTILNCFSQSLFVVKSALTILNNMGLNSDFLNDFLEFLLKQKNNISYFKCTWFIFFNS